VRGSELPAVSICIPTYNNAHFISDAIESALAQTFTDFECIVIDNCSTDNTQKVVAEYLERDKRIKYISNETNVGMGENFNRCLKYASGEYVKFLCADDLLKPLCLENLVRMIKENPSVVLASCARQLTDSSLTHTSTLAYSKRPEMLTGIEVIKRCFIECKNLIGEPTAVLFKKKDGMRGFDLGYRQLMDLEMWFHILEKGDFAFTPEILCLFRQHEGQRTKSNLATDAAIEDEFRIYYDYVNKDYMNISIFKKYEVKYTKAFFAWKQQYSGIDKAPVKTNISRNFGLPLFYVFLTYHKLRNFIIHHIA